MNLPDILKQYFDAANRFDIDGAAECFTTDALVHDEEQNHHGREAIRAWIIDTTEKYHPRIEITDADCTTQPATVSASISGTFPGSPAKLNFAFTLSSGKISRLSIQ